jgi:hypothetical protein
METPGNVIGNLKINLMKNIAKPKRNINISTKVTFEEKRDIQRIANEHNISPYELIYTLVMNFMDHYQFIGQDSPKEEKFKNELELIQKRNRKLNIELENANYRVDIESKLREKIENERNDSRYENKQLSEELKNVKLELKKFNEKEKEWDSEAKKVSQMTKLNIGSLALLGTSFLLFPYIIKK